MKYDVIFWLFFFAMGASMVTLLPSLSPMTLTAFVSAGVYHRVAAVPDHGLPKSASSSASVLFCHETEARETMLRVIKAILLYNAMRYFIGEKCMQVKHNKHV